MHTLLCTDYPETRVCHRPFLPWLSSYLYAAKGQGQEGDGQEGEARDRRLRDDWAAQVCSFPLLLSPPHTHCLIYLLPASAAMLVGLCCPFFLFPASRWRYDTTSWLPPGH